MTKEYLQGTTGEPFFFRGLFSAGFFFGGGSVTSSSSSSCCISTSSTPCAISSPRLSPSASSFPSIALRLPLDRALGELSSSLIESLARRGVSRCLESLLRGSGSSISASWSNDPPPPPSSSNGASSPTSGAWEERRGWPIDERRMLETTDFRGRGDGTASKSTSEARATRREDDPTRLARGDEGWRVLEKYAFGLVLIGPPCDVQVIVRNVDIET